jgi:hypothetical protein
MSSIFLATPSYKGDIRVEFAAALMGVNGTSCPGHNFRIQFVNGDGVARARNNIIHLFLQTECEELLFIDSDIQFTPEHVARLLSHDLDVVGGLYPIKQPGLRWVATAIEGETPDLKTGLQKVLEVGTGFLRVRRRVFEDMIKAFPEIAYHDDMNGKAELKHDFFSMGVVCDPESGIPQTRYLSEDYYFQYRCRKMGIPIYADAFITLGHVGTITYPVPNAA